jgi:hypothetical protein
MARLDINVISSSADAALALDGGSVGGKAKLAQRTLLLMLKDRGTATEPDMDGTGLLETRACTLIKEVLDNTLARAAETASARMLAYPPPDSDGEDALGTLTAYSEAAGADSATIRIAIQNEAGATDTLTL